MAKAADAKHSHKITRFRRRVSQCVESRKPGAQQRRRIGRREAVRDRHEPARLCDHHLGISPIRMNARVFLVTTVHQIAISTEFAITARPSEEADTHALTHRPALDTGAEGIYSPDHFMPWHARPANGKETFHRARIRMAYSAGFDTDSNLSRSWLGNRFLNDFQFPRFCHLYRFILFSHHSFCFSCSVI